MNHTSGLVRYELLPKFNADLTRQPEKTWNPEELIAYIFDTKAPFTAGTKWEYSDTNYIVLGMVIEKVTGKPYCAELRRRILEPLGLKQTVPVEGRKVPGLVQGYAGPRNTFGGKEKMLDERGEMIINPQFEWTGGGIASTPSDLARWGKMLYEGKAFDASLFPTMVEGVTAPMLGREAKYGLGVILRPTPHGPTYGHAGFFPGYMTEMMYWPEHKLAVVVQVNTSEARNVRPPLTRWCVELAGVVIK
jgi:D-alanyl-D-alanine carboxypeptidase